MLQTLVYIPCELFGLPVFGFGLLLALWAVVGTGVLAWLVRRQGFNADTGSYVQVLAVVGVAIAWVLPLLCEPRGLPIRGYGMMILLAVLSGISLAAYRARRVGVDPEMIFALAFWMIVPGILAPGWFTSPSTGPNNTGRYTWQAVSRHCSSPSSTSPAAGWWCTARFSEAWRGWDCFGGGIACRCWRPPT